MKWSTVALTGAFLFTPAAIWSAVPEAAQPAPAITGTPPSATALPSASTLSAAREPSRPPRPVEPPRPISPPPKPKLIVAISVDQLSANLFAEYRPRFTDGLRRLSQGVVYSQGFQSHANTETCPGHSTILTGKRPAKTGLVSNDYAAMPTGQTYCLFDAEVTLPGSTATKVSPKLLMAQTLGDWMKAADPNTRVVSIAGKDRGAITMAGHAPDAVYWYGGSGGFTTYVRPGEDATAAMAPIAAVNAAQARRRSTPPPWRYASPYCRTLESTWPAPRPPPLPPGAAPRATSPPLWRALRLPLDRPRYDNSPLLDDFALEGALSLINRFNLGRGSATDLLTVSFSATDYVGHAWGSRGAEMCEQMLRLDRSIGTLLSRLDQRGVSYAVVLTADHGAADFTERLAANGYNAAQRINTGAILRRVNEALVARFSLAAPPLSGTYDEPRFASAAPEALRPAITAAAVEIYKQQPEIFDAFSFEEVMAATIAPGTPPDEFTLKQRFGASAYPGRSGILFAALKPLSAPGGVLPLAGHGSPWNYDRQVPIIFWWPGAPAQTRFLPIETIDIAPTLADMIGLRTPGDLDGRCLALTPASCRPPRP